MRTLLLPYMLVVTAIVILASCKQSSTSTSTRPKMTVSFLRPDTGRFSFSPDGKLVSRNSFSGSMKQFFSYDKQRVLEEGEGPINGEVFDVTYFLSDRGLMDSSIRFSKRDTNCLAYRFDSAGFRIEEYYGCLEKQLVKRRIIENGNLVKEILFSKGVEKQYVNYGYYDIPNKSTVLGEETFGLAFKGKDSKNLLKEMLLISETQDTLFWNLFNYQFDEAGRVSILGIYTKSGQMIDSVAYFY